MRNELVIIPILTLIANIAILLDVPILRETILFVFLSFVPGFAILNLFKLKDITALDTILFSIALSIADVMFISLVINELYLFLGFSQPLSVVPLTTAISFFTLVVFVIQYRGDSSKPFNAKSRFEGYSKKVLILFVILFLLPLISSLGVLYVNIYALLLSCSVIAALCVVSVLSEKSVPGSFLPLLLFSISVALVCLVLLTSKYIVGSDANLEYSVFKLTQLNGYWGFLNPNTNSVVTQTYDSMLSITLLPAAYSSLMGAQSGIVFKILYPFIFCFVPLALFRTTEMQFGKSVGVLSALFFTFTSVAFFGPEPLSLNRQIVGELFLLLSVFLLVNTTIPVAKRRVLLIIFGAALIVSHYSLTYIYLIMLVVSFFVSKLKSQHNDVMNSVTVLLIFVMAFSWYALATGPPFSSLILTIKNISMELTEGFVPTQGTASSMAAVPVVFTATTWINLLLTGVSYVFLAIGFILIIFKPKRTGISLQFKALLALASIILAASIFVPNIATTLNFSRFYAISLLLLSPCFVIGGQGLLAAMENAWKTIRRALRRQIVSKSKRNGALLIVGMTLGAYFLSQVGFINRVGNGTIYFYSMYFDELKKSNEIQDKIFLYGNYIPDQDVLSATWLQKFKTETSMVSADLTSQSHVLISYGLISNDLFLSLTNKTILPQGSFLYLSSLNVASGVITTSGGPVNVSEISPLISNSDLVYSNGNSEIGYANFAF